MANFANLTAQLNLNIQNFARNMQKASTLASKFASDLQGKINTGMVEPAKKAKFEFKDVSRIVQGIIVSKIFYSSLNAIRRATDAVWEFSKELEYAKMVYSNLFGDTELAQEFINVLKDFAAVTPFSFKQSEEAAKRLLAYGIESKNVMFLMRGVLSAATVQGTDAVIGPISRAMGQIYTKGRLMNEEMRQLAEAGIPVYDILQEKLNLTDEELRNLGRTAISANTALNALVEGINERFGTTMQAASLTTQGIISNIVDNSTMLLAGIFEPFTEYLRGVLGHLGELINELRSIYELKGLGGVFEKLIPPALQQDIRVFIANLKILWDIIKSTLASAFKILGSLLKGLLHAFNALAPAIHTVIGTLAGLLKIITSNEKLMKGLTTAILAAAAAWAIYKLQAVAASITTAVIKGIVGAIKVLVAAMNFVVYHPLWALLALGVGIFVALSGASEKFRNSINNLFKGLYSLGGIDTSKQLLPESKERANDLSKFNNALDGTKKGMDELASATGKATKAAKSLLGFDEVFSLKNPDEGNAADQWEDFMSSFDGASLDLSDMQIEFPNVGEVASGFVDNLIEALGGKDKLLGAGIGGLLGAALGTIIGGPAGTKIGALLGVIAGWFWDELAKQLGLTDVGSLALPISTVLGAAIGLVAGGPLGAVVGAAIGALVGWITDSITRGLQTGDWSKVSLPIGIGIGAAIGLVAGGPIGALIGGAIGALVGWIVGECMKADWSKVGEAFTAPWREFGEHVSYIFYDVIWKPIKDAWDNADWLGLGGAIISGIILGILGGFDAIGRAIVALFKSIWAAICEIFGIHSPARAMMPLGENILLGILEGMLAAVSTLLAGLVGIGKQIVGAAASWFVSVKNSATKNFQLAATIVKTKLGYMHTNVKNGVREIYTSFKNWVNDLWNNVFGKFFKWIDDGITKLGKFFSLESKIKTTTSVPYSVTAAVSAVSAASSVTRGHAVGGVFNREHIARFAEDNKAEAIIPLENASAMQPFVDAVADGLASVLMPMLASITNNNQDQLRPLLVGTLIADDRGLKELNRRMNVIKLEEDARRG